MSLQFKAAGFKAKIASNSKAIAKSFNVEIDRFECKIMSHELISTSVGAASLKFQFKIEFHVAVYAAACEAK